MHRAACVPTAKNKSAVNTVVFTKDHCDIFAATDIIDIYELLRQTNPKLRMSLKFWSFCVQRQAVYSYHRGLLSHTQYTASYSLLFWLK